MIHESSYCGLAFLGTVDRGPTIRIYPYIQALILFLKLRTGLSDRPSCGSGTVVSRGKEKTREEMRRV